MTVLRMISRIEVFVELVRPLKYGHTVPVGDSTACATISGPFTDVLVQPDVDKHVLALVTVLSDSLLTPG